MANFYEQQIANAGSFLGRTLVQAKGDVGGHRYVFVKLQGIKNGLVFPTSGAIIKNPFKGHAKMFAGDLFEYNIDGTGYLLKTYEVAATATGTTVYISRDGYKHIPFVGDVLMLAPETLDGTGTGATVTAVKKTTNAGADVWQLTLSGAIGSLSKGDVLVEAAAAGADVKPLVTNPNCYVPNDNDMLYEPNASDDDFDGAKYLFTPCLANADTYLYEDRMSPIPPAIKALNKSLVKGWFQLY